MTEIGNEEYFKGLVIKTFKDNHELLSFLKKDLLMAPIAMPGCVREWPYFREGQNQVVRKMINILETELHVRIN